MVTFSNLLYKNNKAIVQMNCNGSDYTLEIYTDTLHSWADVGTNKLYFFGALYDTLFFNTECESWEIDEILKSKEANILANDIVKEALKNDCKK